MWFDAQYKFQMPDWLTNMLTLRINYHCLTNIVYTTSIVTVTALATDPLVPNSKTGYLAIGLFKLNIECLQVMRL